MLKTILQTCNINFRLADESGAFNNSLVIKWLRGDQIPGNHLLVVNEPLKARSLSLNIKHPPAVLNKNFGDKKSLSYSNLNEMSFVIPITYQTYHELDSNSNAT